MTSLDTVHQVTARPVARRGTLGLFAATLFVSALLLFALQPMFTKMVLPKLGGSPSVWSVAMVAFQSFLFAGYLYAHLLARWLTPRRAGMAHLAMLALVAMTLPLGIAEGFDVPPADGVMLWLIGLFVSSIGLPFVALSATAPLLQNWFAATGHPQARNPYVLYAASNLGSFCALLAYPFVIEPFLPLHRQSLLWSAGYALLALGIAVAAVMVSGVAPVAPRADVVVRPPLRARAAEWAVWTALMAVPSGLCIAVTAFITTDLAAAPFLWVLPLALYLLTFVGVFRERPWIAHALVPRLLPCPVAALGVCMLGVVPLHWLANIALNLAVFTLIAFACHGEAYRRRPEAGRLTEFYLWTSFGGVVGGVFAGLLAPNIFPNVYEYRLLIVAAMLALPGVFAGGIRRFVRHAGLPLAVAMSLVAIGIVFGARLPLPDVALQAVLFVVALLLIVQVPRPAGFFGIIALAFVLVEFAQYGVAVKTARSFFGVLKVVDTRDGRARLLFQGTTIHGAELMRDEAGNVLIGHPEPLTYYYFGGPIAEAVEAVRRKRGSLNQVAAIGLGAGSMACHRHDGEHWTFFEIDPQMIRLAEDPTMFRFLSACGPVENIVAGDGRITLAASGVRYDLILLDAFSSDSIPVHLVTREAFEGYLGRLTPNGVIVMHISNKHMELASVVAAVGTQVGLVSYFKHDARKDGFLKASTDVIVLAKSTADLGDLPSRPGWTRKQLVPGVSAWTDDYSDVLRAILRRKFGASAP